MPSKDLIRSSSITESMLSPHLRNRLNNVGGNTVNTGYNGSNSDEFTVTLAEAVIINNPIAINNDGKGVIAKATGGILLPAFGVSKSTANINGIVALYNEGDIITIENANFDIGKPVALNDDSIHYTTNFNYIVGSLYQRMGISITNKSFRLKIEEAIFLE